MKLTKEPKDIRKQQHVEYQKKIKIFVDIQRPICYIKWATCEKKHVKYE